MKGNLVLSSPEIVAVGRVETPDAVAPEWVGWDADDVTYNLEGSPLTDGIVAGKAREFDPSRLTTPVDPPKIVAAAVNYVSHAIRRDPPTKPELFYKPISSLIGPGRKIVLPGDADIVEAEGEIVLVIGHATKNVSVAEAENAIFGFTAGFDISARNFQRADRHFWRAKGSDTFSPVGPRIRLGAPPYGALLTTFVNGEEKQTTTVGEMIFSPAELISFASQYLTLQPGDLFYTGTPGVPPGIISGDSIDVRIDGVGTLPMTIA